jgi:hypothetical protein
MGGLINSRMDVSNGTEDEMQTNETFPNICPSITSLFDCI